ncbi:MAG: enoyl-CoA hydratase/isomerase family protein [Pseudomonadota bacterium]
MTVAAPGSTSHDDLAVSRAGHVGVIEIRRPPHNYFDDELVRRIADGLEAFETDPDCRAVLLCSDGRAFCAGAYFGDGQALDDAGQADGSPGDEDLRRLYADAVRIFATSKPIVCAVQGPAIGGGLGLALAADFRVAAPEARFGANFTAIGLHPGFGLTVTLPRVVGHQTAGLLFATARRITGDEALAIGLVDQVVPLSHLRDSAMGLAIEIAANAPLAVQATRKTLRLGLAEAVRDASLREHGEQARLRRTSDFREGVRAAFARRKPEFKAR